MEGKKIGVSSIGGMSTFLVRDLVTQAGLNPERDVTFLSVGGTASRSAALAFHYDERARPAIAQSNHASRQTAWTIYEPRNFG